MNILSLLLPREQYAEAKKKYGRSPNMFEIKNDKKVLFYFGANHSRNPADSQYPILRKYWNKFLKSTEGKDRIILVEDRLRQVIIEDEEEAIVSGAEGAFITLLAHRANVPLACPDINSEKLMELFPNFNRDEFLLYWFLISFDNFQNRTNQKTSFEEWAQGWCEDQKRREQWKSIDISLQKLKKLCRDILGEDFDEKKNYNNVVNPNRTETRINKISRAQSDLRDIHITEEIVRYWNEGKSIFVVFGSGHLIIQEPALKKLLI